MFDFLVFKLTHVQKKLLMLMLMKMVATIFGGKICAKLRLGGFEIQQQRPLQSQMAYGFQGKPFTWLFQNVTNNLFKLHLSHATGCENICYTCK